jgi:putative nucleotidyltransferase with HDIG domain
MSKIKNGKKARTYVKEDLRTLSSTLTGIVSNRSVQMTSLLVAIVIFLAIILFFSPFPSVGGIKVGTLAKQDILASRDLRVNDSRATAFQKAEVMKRVYPVFNYVPGQVEEVEQKIHKAFSYMRDYFEDVLALSSEVPGGTGEARRDTSAAGGLSQRERLDLLVREEPKRRRTFEKMLGVHLKDSEYELLKLKRFSPVIEKKLIQLVRVYKNHWVIRSREDLSQKEVDGIVFHNVATGKETVIHDPDMIFDLEDIRGLFLSRSREILKGLPPPEKYLILSIAQQIIRPNVTYDKVATEERIQKAMEEIQPVVREIRKGDVIISKGERVTPEQMEKLHAMERNLAGIWKTVMFIGFLLLTFFTIYIPYDFSLRNIRKIKFQTRDLIFLGILLVVFPLALKFYYYLSFAIKAIFPYLDARVLLFLFPIAAAGMFVRIALNSEIALVFSVVLCIFFSVIIDSSASFGLIVFLMNLLGAELVSRCEKRSKVLWAGIATGVLGGILVAADQMIRGSFISYATGWGVLFSIIGGFISGILVLGFTPLLETLFGYTTDVKLLELANLDHPLLKEMILKAPGTYHHSIMVASLAEAAARDIGAHPILVRVGAYYHDIGKIKKALYFIENQQGGENKHDKLSPNMSSLILISHVKEGVELAKSYRLGSEIIDIIQEHHGTSLIRYFYKKAVEAAGGDPEKVDEKIFRYPGPKPQTREAGLIMLADAVEATAKSLDTPTPSRITTIVQETINRIFLDGQLDECELTLKNLHQIADRFRMVLMAIFHHRIDYPSLEGRDVKKDKGEKWPTYGQKIGKVA